MEIELDYHLLKIQDFIHWLAHGRNEETQLVLVWLENRPDY